MKDKKMVMMLVMLVIILVSSFYAYQGVAMHKQVTIDEAKFHALQETYFTNSKVIRDSAETGSDLNKDLVEIKNYPSTLLKLKLVGVGKILTGIFILLLGILIALMVMPMRLGAIIRSSKRE